MNRKIRASGGALVVVALLAALVPTAVVATTPPPTLSGTFLTALVGDVPGATVDIVADCDPDGTSTISWSASGQSTALFGPAPYPGGFVETGTASLGIQDGGPGYVNGIPLGTPLAVEVFFSIDSPAGQIIGTKRMTAATTFKQGACRDLVDYLLPDGSRATGEYRRVAAQWGIYEALIVTGDAAWLDTGEADTFLEHFTGTGMAEVNSVQEFFRSSQSAVEPAPGGRATGGGRVGDLTFGFNAMNDKSGPKGRCAVVDASAGVMINCQTVTSIAVWNDRATIFGDAVIDGQVVRYRMDVTDADESGAGADSWTIRLSNGFVGGGILTEGNVQVHK